MNENPYELIYMSRCGDEWSLQALFRLYEPGQRAMVNNMINRYRPLEIYRDDLVQEGMVTLYKAIDTYREDAGCSFKTFLNVLTERKIYSLLRHYSAQSMAQMHNMVYLEDHISDSGSIYEVIPLQDMMSDPQYNLRYQEAMERVKAAWAKMNKNERAVYQAYTKGLSYEEGSTNLAISYKTYDGRLQRAKQRIKKAITQA